MGQRFGTGRHTLVAAAVVVFGLSGLARAAPRPKSLAIVTTDFGAKGDGKTDDTKAIQAALDSGAAKVVIPAGDYLITAQLTTHSGQVVEGEGSRNSTLRKAYAGFILDLAPWAELREVHLVGESARFKGGGVVISSGANTTDVSKQGHQLIARCSFEDFAGYAIEYAVPNMGWMSSVEDCMFTGIAAPASIRWPDEPTNGGNRQVVGCYSSGPLVDAGGADNGIIARNAVGGKATSDQGVVFPAGTAHRAKKIIITANRFAIANGTMTIRGADLVFSDNIVAGNFELEPDNSNDGATNCRFETSNLLVGALADKSGADNQIDTRNMPFAVHWSAAQDQPVLGDADARCEYSRRSAYVTAHCFIKFGASTKFGSGAWTFATPIPIPGKTTSTDFVGAALLNGRSGVVRTIRQSNEDAFQLFDSDGHLVGGGSPIHWTAGDTLMFEITYRSF